MHGVDRALSPRLGELGSLFLEHSKVWARSSVEEQICSLQHRRLVFFSRYLFVRDCGAPYGAGLLICPSLWAHESRIGGAAPAQPKWQRSESSSLPRCARVDGTRRLGRQSSRNVELVAVCPLGAVISGALPIVFVPGRFDSHAVELSHAPCGGKAKQNGHLPR